MPTSPRRPAAERGRLRAVNPLPDSLPAAPLTYFLLRVLMISLPDKDLVTCRFHGADRTQSRSNFAFLKTVSSLEKRSSALPASWRCAGPASTAVPRPGRLRELTVPDGPQELQTPGRRDWPGLCSGLGVGLARVPGRTRKGGKPLPAVTPASSRIGLRAFRVCGPVESRACGGSEDASVLKLIISEQYRRPAASEQARQGDVAVFLLKDFFRGHRQAQSPKHAALCLGVINSGPTLGAEIT